MIKMKQIPKKFDTPHLKYRQPMPIQIEFNFAFHQILTINICKTIKSQISIMK